MVEKAVVTQFSTSTPPSNFASALRFLSAIYGSVATYDVTNGSPEIYNPPYTEANNNGFPPSWFIYERKRWTGPEFKLVKTHDHSELPGDGVLNEPPPIG